MSLDHCAFARAFLEWCVANHLITFRERDALMDSVKAHEVRIIACAGKRSFASFTQANEVATRKNRREVARHAYHCQLCGQFHIGTFSPTKRRLRLRLTKRPEYA